MLKSTTACIPTGLWGFSAAGPPGEESLRKTISMKYQKLFQLTFFFIERQEETRTNLEWPEVEDGSSSRREGAFEDHGGLGGPCGMEGREKAGVLEEYRDRRKDCVRAGGRERWGPPTVHAERAEGEAWF